MIFKGSWPSLKFQDCKWRYLGSKTRLRTQNSSVGVKFNKLAEFGPSQATFFLLVRWSKFESDWSDEISRFYFIRQ